MYTFRLWARIACVVAGLILGGTLGLPKTNAGFHPSVPIVIIVLGASLLLVGVLPFLFAIGKHGWALAAEKLEEQRSIRKTAKPTTVIPDQVALPIMWVSDLRRVPRVAPTRSRHTEYRVRPARVPLARIPRQRPSTDVRAMEAELRLFLAGNNGNDHCQSDR